MGVDNELFREGGTDVYYFFSNADRKFWIIPQKNYKTGLCIYQPTRLKGRLLRKCFFLFSLIPPLKKIARLKEFKYSVSKDFTDFIKPLMKAEHIEVSLFSGTPSIHQKATVQLSHNRNILAYCKLTASHEIAENFFREAALLKRLNQLNVTHIPECIYVGNWKNNLNVFVQSTNKTVRSSAIHQFTSLHWQFIERLHHKTVQEIDYFASDFFRSISYLVTVKGRFTQNAREAIGNAVKEVNSFFEKREQVSFSAYHGDFTPWNTYLEKGKLYVFDFEYCKMSYPPFLDWFHFFTQVAVFKERLGAPAVYRKFGRECTALNSHFHDPVFMYKCYLLDIISFYIQREKGKVEGEIRTKILIYSELLLLL